MSNTATTSKTEIKKPQFKSQYENFIGGKWTSPTKGEYFENISPVDGKVVIIEEVFEKEFFKDKRLQVSIFMSPINVHVTRYAISGSVIFSKYHPGKYMVAWHPKSSELNERTTVVVENKTVGQILYRQIAGALARRIVNYAKVGDEAVQGSDAGFIKFGSRVDLFLPIGAKLNVKKDQVLKLHLWITTVCPELMKQ